MNVVCWEFCLWSLGRRDINEHMPCAGWWVSGWHYNLRWKKSPRGAEELRERLCCTAHSDALGLHGMLRASCGASAKSWACESGGVCDVWATTDAHKAIINFSPADALWGEIQTFALLLLGESVPRSSQWEARNPVSWRLLLRWSVVVWCCYEIMGLGGHLLVEPASWHITIILSPKTEACVALNN